MIFFRADSNKQIASGHIMRCLSIAQAFEEVGEDVEFLIADENPIPMLEQANVNYTILHSTWNNLMKEVSIVRSRLQAQPNSLLFIDTYQVSRQYVEELLPYARICYLGSKQEYLGPILALINYSTDIDYDFYSIKYGTTTKLLLGAAYAPLRKEFMGVRHSLSKDGKCRILLTTGNTDARNYVGKILAKLTENSISSQIEVQVVLGGMFGTKEELHNLYDNHPNVVLHENIKLMSSLMSTCELAISANGTTVYELAAANVPVVSFAMVEEQVKSARKLAELNVVDYCGEIYNNESLVISNIVKETIHLVASPQDRLKQAKKANSVIDGRGCERIVKTLMNI